MLTSQLSEYLTLVDDTQTMWFGKSKLSVVERYINKLMRTGSYTGKKQSRNEGF